MCESGTTTHENVSVKVDFYIVSGGCNWCHDITMLYVVVQTALTHFEYVIANSGLKYCRCRFLNQHH